MSDNQPAQPKKWELGPESEYRFELDPGTSLAVKLVKGQAEIFGFELAEGKVYLFGSECKAAVFTWRGCVIEVTGEPSTEYVSDETPMRTYANLHIALEQMRVRALRAIRGSPVPLQEKSKSDPPRVLILGPEHAGKTTVCKILTNYAVRAGQGWTPFLVNVDPSEGGWAAPGALSVAPVLGPIPTASPANPLGTAATTAPVSLTSNALLPLVYWYGHAETKRNPLLMDRMIRNLGENIMDRFELDNEGRASGLIVDTPSSFASGPSSNTHRQKLIKACIDAFRINMIIVVGHDKLSVEMQRTYGSLLSVVKIPKSGGVVEVDYSYRERVHNYQLYTYMYGQVIRPPSGITNGSLGGENLTDLVLSPSSTVINFNDLQIYRIGSDTMAPSDALPVGATRTVSEMQPVLVDPASPGSGLLNAVLALLSPANPDENERYDEEILDLPVVGFLIVTNIDMAKRKMTILAPNRGSYTGKTAVIGSFEWQDQ
ncbi:Pre-mRNA cleavage complex II protein Clp1-domain-containing protein [Flammula alnicola]|nr:Pre-mRNA cleavage complex II protein Clp1-domain-containing protein [Flammula alnicola]